MSNSFKEHLLFIESEAFTVALLSGCMHFHLWWQNVVIYQFLICMVLVVVSTIYYMCMILNRIFKLMHTINNFCPLQKMYFIDLVRENVINTEDKIGVMFLIKIAMLVMFLMTILV